MQEMVTRIAKLYRVDEALVLKTLYTVMKRRASRVSIRSLGQRLIDLAPKLEWNGAVGRL